MSATVDRARPGLLRVTHAFLLAATVPPFLGAALSDYAYASSYHVQWINFSSWLIVGGLVFGVGALACALVDLLRTGHRGGRIAVAFFLLLAACVLGFINALVHASDAWASMPAGLILSLSALAFAGAAAAIGFSTLRMGGKS